MTDWIIRFVEQGGYLAIGVLMFLENVFPPIPSELIMPLGGFVSGAGKLSFVGVCAAGTLGSVLGQLPLYYLGRLANEQRLRRLIQRHGKWLLVDENDLDRAGQWFDRHGLWAVVICRLVPGVRSLISLPAGVRRMNLARFLGCSALGMGVWATGLAGIGRLLGRNYERVENYIGPATYVVIAALIVAFVMRALRKRRQQAV